MRREAERQSSTVWEEDGCGVAETGVKRVRKSYRSAGSSILVDFIQINDQLVATLVLCDIFFLNQLLLFFCFF